jgi:hypothetical protein
MSTLDGPGFQQDGPSLGSLKTGEEVAKMVRLSAARILQLSRAEVLPHFRIDGGEPLFSLPILKAYVRRHLTVACEGAPLPTRQILRKLFNGDRAPFTPVIDEAGRRYEFKGTAAIAT